MIRRPAELVLGTELDRGLPQMEIRIDGMTFRAPAASAARATARAISVCSTW
jgi:hypothetical protein